MSLVMTAKKSLFLLRIDAGYDSQPKLGHAARISVTTVWKAEVKKEATVKVAHKIVNALNVGLKAHGFDTVTENDIDWTIT